MFVLLLLERSPVLVEAQVQVQVQVQPPPASLATFLLRKTFCRSIHTNPSGGSYTLAPRAPQFSSLIFLPSLQGQLLAASSRVRRQCGTKS